MDGEKSTEARYPRPSPRFPAPPRPVPNLGFVGVLIASLASVAGFAAAALLVRHDFIWLSLAAGCGSLGFGIGGTLLLLARRLTFRHWRNGRIVPVIILRGPTGPGESVVWTLLGFIPHTFILFSIIGGWVVGKRNWAHGVTEFDGDPYVLSWPTGKHYKKYANMTACWMLVDRKLNAKPMESYAPRKFWLRPVPDELERWLLEGPATDFDSEASAHSANIFDAEAHAAAKANTRALRKRKPESINHDSARK